MKKMQKSPVHGVEFLATDQKQVYRAFVFGTEVGTVTKQHDARRSYWFFSSKLDAPAPYNRPSCDCTSFGGWNNWDDTRAGAVCQYYGGYIEDRQIGNIAESMKEVEENPNIEPDDEPTPTDRVGLALLQEVKKYLLTPSIERPSFWHRELIDKINEYQAANAVDPKLEEAVEKLKEPTAEANEEKTKPAPVEYDEPTPAAANEHGLEKCDTIIFTNKKGYRIEKTVTRTTEKSCFWSNVIDGAEGHESRESWGTVNGYFRDFDVEIKKPEPTAEANEERTKPHDLTSYTDYPAEGGFAAVVNSMFYRRDCGVAQYYEFEIDEVELEDKRIRCRVNFKNGVDQPLEFTFNEFLIAAQRCRLIEEDDGEFVKLEGDTDDYNTPREIWAKDWILSNRSEFYRPAGLMVWEQWVRLCRVLKSKMIHTSGEYHDRAFVDIANHIDTDFADTVKELNQIITTFKDERFFPTY